ncbi:MAG: PorT family protein [Bacteroidetes bacterium]|nr:PorT family protein [Bacteroidota bacterium]
MMKKTLFTLALVLGAIIMLQAQIEIKPTFGLNFSRLSDEPENFNQSARVGFQFGGSVAIGKKFYVEPGIFWTKMSKDLVHADDKDFDFENNISAIRIPAFVGYQIIGGDEENILGVRVFGGPSMSWITKIESNDTELDKEDFNSLLWGINAGAGVDVWLLFLDVGHEWGLNQVFKEDPNEAKNHAWWFNIGMRFRF